MKPSDYHHLTFAAKRARVMATHARVVMAVCPACGIQTPPEGLLRHLESSCPGRRVSG